MQYGVSKYLVTWWIQDAESGKNKKKDLLPNEYFLGRKFFFKCPQLFGIKWTVWLFPESEPGWWQGKGAEEWGTLDWNSCGEEWERANQGHVSERS